MLRQRFSRSIIWACLVACTLALVGGALTFAANDAGGYKVLRRIPVDPLTGKDEWGLRSVQDDVDSDSWGGQNVFDIYSKSEGTGLDGTKYKTW